MGAICKGWPACLVDDGYIAFNVVYRPLIYYYLTRQYLYSKALLSLYKIHP